MSLLLKIYGQRGSRMRDKPIIPVFLEKILQLRVFLYQHLTLLLDVHALLSLYHLEFVVHNLHIFVGQNILKLWLQVSIGTLN